MSKNRKGMICLLNSWEWEDQQVNGIVPDCCNHHHISRRRACERFEDARFADHVLAYVYDFRDRRVGFIAQIGNRVIWTRHDGDWKSVVLIVRAQRKIIDAHIARFQAMIDTGKQPFFEKISLPPGSMESRNPSCGAAINQTLKSQSPCSTTAHESELNAEGPLAEQRRQRDHER
jgi:hypothetical protein